MDEQKAWIRSRRKRRLRLTAAILAVCLLVTTYPNILEAVSVFAAGLRSGGTMSITGFVELPEETAKQTVPVGTDRSELELPDTLEAYVTVGDKNDTEDDRKLDDGDQNKDDDEDEVIEDENSDTGETETADFSVQTGSFVLPEYQSENVITVETLESRPIPVKEESVTIYGITWQSVPEYDGNAEETYIFTAILPEGYAPAEGVSLPQIAVTVQENGEDVAVQTLLDRITALPDVQEYMEKEPDIDNWNDDDDAYEEAYEEWMEGLSAYAEEALAIWEEYEALTQEQQAQIPEELLTKLTAWVELAEQAAGSRKVMAAASGDLKGHTNHSGWAVLYSYTNLSQGNYYLKGDIGSITIPEGLTVNVCLNGHKMSGITVESGATLNLYDCQGGGTISGTGNAVIDASGTGTTVNLYGGTISGTNYRGIDASGTGTTVNLYGGTVSVVNSSGVKLENGAHLLVDGAEVKSEFTKKPNGVRAAVDIESGASAEIKSGSVSIVNTTQASNVAIIWVDGGSLIVSGGTVEGTGRSFFETIWIDWGKADNYEDSRIEINGGTINAGLTIRRGKLVVNNTKIGGFIDLKGVLQLKGGQSIGSARSEYANYANIGIGINRDAGGKTGIIELTGSLTNQEPYTLQFLDISSSSKYPFTVTRNFSDYMSGKDPTAYFTYQSSGGNMDHYKIIQQDGEVVLLPYVMTFDANGGTLEDSTTITDGKGDITGRNYMRELPEPTRDGYAFDGWYTQKTGGTEVTLDDELYKSEKDVTVYAHWTPIEYPIIYELNGGTLPAGKTNPETYTIETADFTLNNPERTGCTFTGWSGTGLTGNTTKTVTVNKGSMGERTYTANWGVANYTVTYNKNSGTIANENSYTSYTFGTSLTLPTPTRTGYKFGGWYEDAACSGTKVEKISTTDTGNKTYYAKWTANTYTVTFNYQSATGGNSETNRTVTYDSTYGTVSGTSKSLPSPTRTGYTFKGWHTLTGGSGNKITDTTAVKITAAQTLYAYWKDETPPDIPVLQTGVTLPTGWTNTQNTIPLTLYDGVGVTELWVRVDGGAYTKVSGFPSGSTEYAYAAADGEHTYQFKARDAAGNESSASVAYKVMQDTNPPEIDLTNMSVVNGTKGLWNWIIGKKSMIIKIPASDITDAHSGIAEVTCTATPDSGTEQTRTIRAKGGYYEIALKAEFTGTIRLTAEDNAGNITQASLTADGGKVIAEDYAPVVTITLPDTPTSNANGWYTTGFAITVTVTDDQDSGSAAITSGGIAKITWKNGENGAEQTVPGLPGAAPVYEKEFTITAAEGTNTYHVKAVDNAGNESGWQTVTVCLDTIAPAFSVTPVVTDRTQESADIAFTSSEGGKAYWIVDAGAAPDAREAADKGAESGNEKDIAGSTRETFAVGGFQPGTLHKVYMVLEDAAGNLSEVKEVSFTTLQAAPTLTLMDLIIDYRKETGKLPEGMEELEVYTNPSDPERSMIPLKEDGSRPIVPGQPIYIRYPAKTEDGETTPPSGSVRIDIPDRPTLSAKRVTVTDTMAKVTDPAAGEEYVLVEKGRTPDWSEADTTGEFTGLDPNTEYDLYARKKATDTSFISDPVKTEVRTFVTIKEPVITGDGKGKDGNTAPGTNLLYAVAGGTVTFSGTYGEEFTPVIIVGNQEMNPGAVITWNEGSGKGGWEYTLAIPEDAKEAGITVEFRKRTMTGIAVMPDTLTIYADHAANESIDALTSYLKENSSVQAVYDNKTKGVAQAEYTTTDSFSVKGAVYSYNVTAGGKTEEITLTVASVTAAPTLPKEITRVKRAGGYTAEEAAAWLPAQVTVTYTGDGLYTARTESRTVTWDTASVGADFGKTLGRKKISGTVELPAWATGQDSVSIGIEFVDRFILTDSQMALSVSGWTYGAQTAPAPQGSITVTDTNPVYAYLYSADNGGTWVTAPNLPKSESGNIVPGEYRVKMTYRGDNYTGEKTASFTVTRKALDILPGTLAVNNKNYDGTTEATLKEGGEPVLSGVVEGDIVIPSGTLSAVFTNKGPKKNIPVTVTGFELEGRDAGYYELKNATPTLYATINNADGTPPSSGGTGGGGTGSGGTGSGTGGGGTGSGGTGSGTGGGGTGSGGTGSGTGGGGTGGGTGGGGTGSGGTGSGTGGGGTGGGTGSGGTGSGTGSGGNGGGTGGGGNSGGSTPGDGSNPGTPSVTPPADKTQPDPGPEGTPGREAETQPKRRPEGKPEQDEEPESTDTETSGQDSDPAQPEDKPQPEDEAVLTVPVSIVDGRIVADDEIGSGDGGSGNSADGGRISTGNVSGMAADGVTPKTSTLLALGDGAVIVTVVCGEQKCTAGVADTIAVANAVLTPEKIQLVNDGETIEVRIEVKDISETVSGQDKEVIEKGLAEYQKKIPELTLGMYVDLSVFVRIDEGNWNAVTSTKEPIEVIIGLPKELQEDGREFYIIRSHEGEYTLLKDVDDDTDTITISTNLFSAYAIAFRQTDTDAAQGKNVKCGLCHICPTFLGICCFIWLAIIAAVIIMVVIVILRRKKETDKA